MPLTVPSARIIKNELKRRNEMQKHNETNEL